MFLSSKNKKFSGYSFVPENFDKVEIKRDVLTGKNIVSVKPKKAQSS